MINMVGCEDFNCRAVHWVIKQWNTRYKEPESVVKASQWYTISCVYTNASNNI